MQDTRKLPIAGCGSAGCMAAACLERRSRFRRAQACGRKPGLIAERAAYRRRRADHPRINHVLAIAGIKQQDFMRRVDGTFKRSIRFVDWLQRLLDMSVYRPMSKMPGQGRPIPPCENGIGSMADRATMVIAGQNLKQG